MSRGGTDGGESNRSTFSNVSERGVEAKLQIYVYSEIGPGHLAQLLSVAAKEAGINHRHLVLRWICPGRQMKWLQRRGRIIEAEL